MSWHSWHCAFNSGDPFLYVTLYMKSFQVLLVTLHKTSNNIWKMVVGRWFSLLHRWNMWSFPGGYALCIFVHDIPVEILVEHDLHPGQWEYDLHHICPREGGWRICIDNVLIIWNSFLLDFGSKTRQDPPEKEWFFPVKGLSCCLAVTTWPTTTWGLNMIESRMTWTPHNFHQILVMSGDVIPKRIQKVPSWELTYPLPTGTFEDVFPFPKVGHVIVPWRVFVV